MQLVTSIENRYKKSDLNFYFIKIVHKKLEFANSFKGFKFESNKYFFGHKNAKKETLLTDFLKNESLDKNS
jgi:hypothetical protein